jgi:ketosteroid isomerase-like protein
MFDDPMRGFARAFCDALATREPSRIAPLIDDNIDWTVFGPVDLFPFFGQRRGKAAVLAMFAELSDSLRLRGCDTERTLSVGDNAASMMRINAIDTRTGRPLSLRLALFAQFNGDKLKMLRAVFDTFDAAEQALGRHIDLSEVA